MKANIDLFTVIINDFSLNQNTIYLIVNLMLEVNLKQNLKK